MEIGVSGGLAPPLENPTRYAGAFADSHGKSEADPKNQNGTLPPVPQKKGIPIRRKKNIDEALVTQNGGEENPMEQMMGQTGQTNQKTPVKPEMPKDSLESILNQSL